jgi:glutaredoxin
MNNKIVLFTMNGCGHCKSLKNRLDEISIPYFDIDIDENEEIWDQVVSQTKEDLIPTIFIQSDESDNGIVFVPGRDYESEDDIVEKIKTYV